VVEAWSLALSPVTFSLPQGGRSVGETSGCKGRALLPGSYGYHIAFLVGCLAAELTGFVLVAVKL